MPYKPGDNYTICDLSGKKIYQSEAVRTWDGLLVCKDWWYEKHPQLTPITVVDDMAAPDSHPRQPETFVSPTYGAGQIILQSLNGSLFQVVVSDGGVVSTAGAPWQFDVPVTVLNSWQLTVDNSGTLVPVDTDLPGPSAWMMASPNGVMWYLTCDGTNVTAVPVQ